jgi:predicted Rossmann fold flavoprotein
VREPVDIAVVGAGAAGLMAAIQAGRQAPELSVVALDGARKLGAKILVAGGGRCNVTHERVTERDFAGSTPAAIRRVLRRFDVPEVVGFFRELDLALQREESGKLFPVTNRARSVLQALLRAAEAAKVELLHPWRVERLERRETPPGGFRLHHGPGWLEARRVILATGGRSFPRTGSDGHGYALARGLGHSITPLLLPALVPLRLPNDHFLCRLSGVSADAEVSLRSGGGRLLARFRGPVLCTHFGVSGPAVLDASRHFLAARAADPAAGLVLSLRPGESAEAVDAVLLARASESAPRALQGRPPERLARALCEAAGVEPGRALHQVPREARRRLARLLTALPLPVVGDRGFEHAEATAGGVPLAELRLESLESRRCPGLHLCGEICDVDGRIGGFNFQWAWASGFVAGRGAALALRHQER